MTLGSWPDGPIRCTDKQAEVCKVLWSCKGVEMHRDRVMQRANQEGGNRSIPSRSRSAIKESRSTKARSTPTENSYIRASAMACTGCRARPRASLRPDDLPIQAGRRTQEIDTRTSCCPVWRCACATAKKLAEISREQGAKKGRTGPHRPRGTSKTVSSRRPTGIPFGHRPGPNFCKPLRR